MTSKRDSDPRPEYHLDLEDMFARLLGPEYAQRFRAASQHSIAHASEGEDSQYLISIAEEWAGIRGCLRAAAVRMWAIPPYVPDVPAPGVTDPPKPKKPGDEFPRRATSDHIDCSKSSWVNWGAWDRERETLVLMLRQQYYMYLDVPYGEVVRHVGEVSDWYRRCIKGKYESRHVSHEELMRYWES